MRPDDRDRHRGGEGGIPDGLLVGVLAFVLGMTVMVWTATGLAGLFAHGSWPAEVTFGHTPLAMRQLVEAPHDIAAAWPETPKTQLSGYGLFWGLFIGQLMVLLVLTVFVMGTAARWRAGRARRRALAASAMPEPTPEPEAKAEQQPQPRSESVPREAAPRPAVEQVSAAEPVRAAEPPLESVPSVADGNRLGGWESIPAEGAGAVGVPTPRGP